MRKVVLAAVAATIVSGGVWANDEHVGASLNYGLGGVGLDVAYALMPDFVSLRAGINGGLSLSGTTTPYQTAYNYNLNTGYKTLGADWHPFGGGFRLSAGYAWSDIKLDVSANGAYTFNGTPYVGTATGQIKYNNAPYVSFGWGHHAPKDGGLFFNSEFGVMLTGKPDVTLAAAGATATDIEAEKQKVKNSAIDFFPIVKVGVGYSF